MDKRFFAGLNLAEDFVGQGVQALLEMEIETSGLSDSDTHVIF